MSKNIFKPGNLNLEEYRLNKRADFLRLEKLPVLAESGTLCLVGAPHLGLSSQEARVNIPGSVLLSAESPDSLTVQLYTGHPLCSSPARL